MCFAIVRASDGAQQPTPKTKCLSTNCKTERCSPQQPVQDCLIALVTGLGSVKKRVAWGFWDFRGDSRRRPAFPNSCLQVCTGLRESFGPCETRSNSQPWRRSRASSLVSGSEIDRTPYTIFNSTSETASPSLYEMPDPQFAFRFPIRNSQLFNPGGGGSVRWPFLQNAKARCRRSLEELALGSLLPSGDFTQ